MPNEGLARDATCLLSPRSLFPRNLRIEGGGYHDSGLPVAAIDSTWISLDHRLVSAWWYLIELKINVSTVSKDFEFQ